MARPKKCRRICAMPRAHEFTPECPAGGEVLLTLDELETLRLMDVERLTQEQCALQMEVARATVALIYDAARAKVAHALVYGEKLRITGGEVKLCRHAEHCCGRCGTGGCFGCARQGCGRREQMEHDQERKSV